MVASTGLNQVDTVTERAPGGRPAVRTTSYGYDVNGNVEALTHDVAG